MLRTILSGLYSLCVAILFSGCASLNQPKMEAADTSSRPENAFLKLNVAGGFFDTFKTGFSPKVPERFELALLDRNIYKNWAPVQTMCFGPKVPGDEICIRIAAFATADRKQLSLTKHVARLDKVETDDDLIPGNFPHGNKIIVDVRWQDGTLYFKVNNGAEIAHPVSFIPESVRFTCSSTVCTFKY